MRRAPLALALVLLGCGGASAPPPAAMDDAVADDPAPVVPSGPYACSVETWRHEELDTAVGHGADARAAHADAERQLCARVAEPCPTPTLFAALDHRGAGAPGSRDWTAGVPYRLIRLIYEVREAESPESRLAACALAERRARETAPAGAAHGISGINGLRWSDLFGGAGPFPPTAAAHASAIRALPFEPTPGERFECELTGLAASVLWSHQLPGNAGDACLAAAPGSLRGAPGRASYSRCDPSGECATHCVVLGPETDLRVKGVSESSQREACARAVERFCPGGECVVRIASVEGIDGEALGAMRISRSGRR